MTNCYLCHTDLSTEDDGAHIGLHSRCYQERINRAGNGKCTYCGKPADLKGDDTQSPCNDCRPNASYKDYPGP